MSLASWNIYILDESRLMLERDELRKKIKQLKYKIDKEQTTHQELLVKGKALKQLETAGTALLS